MNVYFYIILTALLLEFLISTVADVLNLKWLDKPLPAEFKGYYPEDKYLNSMKYTKTRTYFGFITTSFDLILILVFWLSGGFAYLNSVVMTISESMIFRGLAFVGILIFANAMLSLPFSIYSTFVIEERFGFNKSTVKTFVTDLIKSLLLSMVIGIPILILLLYILKTFGSSAWIYGWVAVTLIGLIMQYIAPRWIMPLFNKFRPLEDGELRDSIMEYAGSVHFSLGNVYVMDGSKRSSKSNAFFTGFGKNKRIALFDTLIEKHTVKELVGILAHEIGHYKHKHILYGMLISFLHTGLMFYVLSIFLFEKGLYEAFFMSETPIYAGLLFFGMLFNPFESIISVFMNIFSRKNEFAADEFAVKTTKDKENFSLALKKLSVDNLSNLTPHPFLVFMSYSHPTTHQRLQKIAKL